MTPADRQNNLAQAVSDAFWLALVNAFVYIRHPFLTKFANRNRDGLPNPACPQHLFDKFLWRKVFDHDPSSVALSDKLKAKEAACELCDDVKVPRTLWIGKRFEDIPAEILVGDIVIKTNHGSGYFQLIRKGKYDRSETIARTRKWMRTDYSWYHGEWAYRNIERRLFVEEMLKDSAGDPVRREAKVNVFGGTALCAFYFHDRLADKARLSLYDRQGNPYEYDQYEDYPVAMEAAPVSLPKMFNIAARLAAGRDYVRVDLYEVDGDIYFSEFTFYNMAGTFGSGVQKEFPQMTELWDLRKSWFLSQPQSGWRGAYARWLRARFDRLESSIE